MGNLYKFVNCLLAECVNIGLIVVPRTFLLCGYQGIPFSAAGCIVFADTAVFGKLAVFVKNNVIDCHKIGFTLIKSCLARKMPVTCCAEFKASHAETRIFRNVAAGKARRPLVLIIKVCKHTVLFCFFGAEFDKVHKILAEIRHCHTGSGMHMKAAEAHFMQTVNLLAEHLGGHFAVPCPERSTEVFGGGVFKKSVIKLFCGIFFIEHHFSPFVRSGCDTAACFVRHRQNQLCLLTLLYTSYIIKQWLFFLYFRG